MSQISIATDIGPHWLPIAQSVHVSVEDNTISVVANVLASLSGPCVSVSMRMLTETAVDLLDDLTKAIVQAKCERDLNEAICRRPERALASTAAPHPFDAGTQLPR